MFRNKRQDEIEELRKAVEDLSKKVEEISKALEILSASQRQLDQAISERTEEDIMNPSGFNFYPRHAFHPNEDFGQEGR